MKLSSAINFTITIVCCFSLVSCGQNNNQSATSKSMLVLAEKQDSSVTEEPEIVEIEYETFSNAESQNRIADKIANGKPLVVHVMVPLCDNEHQGIVPVNKTLGDGFNPRTNLYWGALYGIKTHFKKLNSWKLLSEQQKLSESIVERVVFYRELPNNAKVYLVADAYRGDKMKACLTDFFKATSGKSSENIIVNEVELGIRSNADLLVMNGHNGLMDVDVDYFLSEDDKVREVGLIGCVTASYFREYLLRSKAFPVLSTNNLMAPEAYVLNGFVEAWATQKSDSQIHASVAQAYHEYQKCGVKGAGRLFRVGW